MKETLKVTGRNEYEKKEQDMVALKLSGNGITAVVTGPAECMDWFKKGDYVDLELKQVQKKLEECKPVETKKKKSK